MAALRLSTVPRARGAIAVAFAGLLVACALNTWVFNAYFDRSYIAWYADTGPFIGIATAAFAAAWGDLDENPALVSANPLTYVGACLQVAGLPLVAIGSHLRTENRLKPVGFELPLVMILALLLLVAMIAWLLVVVPAQYFLFLLVGSLSRIANTSSARIAARVHSGQVELSPHPEAERNPDEGWWDASMRNKPFSLTSAFGAAVLFLIGMLWD